MIPHLTSTVDGSFTLAHPDLHIGNIFVAEDFNVTGLINWGSTTTGPITELLAT
jgi:aminoglycoside phosphotransferase (APT) family kinase protein